MRILIYKDGADDPTGLNEIVKAWKECWEKHYSAVEGLEFSKPKNCKHQNNISDLPEEVTNIFKIRNPDIFFICETNLTPLGGVEITVHSPDGSNAEKRYPYIWASNVNRISGIIICPYSKTRSNHSINKIPGRLSERNRSFLNNWNPGDANSTFLQIIPIKELQGGTFSSLPQNIKDSIVSFHDIGEFFAHSLALKNDPTNMFAIKCLSDFKIRLNKLVTACIDNTTFTEQSTLLKTDDKWIQIYNCRPDSGHWERGEGQFDSIDGRIMFTLDTINALPPNDRPNSFEFWLPQMCSNHPWIVEQREHEFGSKRLKNILVTLAPYCKTKFANELTEEDWLTLRNNPQLLLEREDWKEGIYNVALNVPSDKRNSVAKAGIRSSNFPYEAIEALFNNENIYFSSHKAYSYNYLNRIEITLLTLPTEAVVYFPRIPTSKLTINNNDIQCTVIPAEKCPKNVLFMLRQLHRYKKDLV